MGSVILSNRLLSLCRMVKPGNRVVDVGCDHGFVSIYLVQQGISPHVLAMDVRPGPLSRAEEHVAGYCLEEYIETRLSDGLLEYDEGEADTMICAGMGGRLMMKILSESAQKAKGLRELILQPQSELFEFRRFLKSEGYMLLDENILCEDGKYYFLMKVRWGDSREEEFPAEAELSDVEEPSEANKLSGTAALPSSQEIRLYEKFGELLLKRRDPVLKAFLQECIINMRQVESGLAENKNLRAQERLLQVRQEIEDLEAALGYFL